jgi:hypothetical protein
MRVFKLHLVLAEKFKAYYINITDPRQGPLASKFFFYCLFLAVLAPHQLGFPTSNPSQMGKLSTLVQRLCRVLVSSLPNNSQKRRDFLSIFSSRLEKDQFNLLSYELKHSAIEVERTRNLARGYQSLHTTGVLYVFFFFFLWSSIFGLLHVEGMWKILYAPMHCLCPDMLVLIFPLQERFDAQRWIEGLLTRKDFRTSFALSLR